MRLRRSGPVALLACCVTLCPRLARADHALAGPELVRLLGGHAQHVFAPKSSRLGALVTLPAGQTASSLGLAPYGDGYGRLHATPADLVAYASAHPDLEIEVAPPLHTLLDQAGGWIGTTEARHRLGFDGKGVLVGVADTGLDVTLPDLRDPRTGKSRVAWLLDLSLPPAGLYPDIEREFCVQATDGSCQLGAVLQGTDIDALIASGSASIPIDEYGHGTHVTSIAAGNGGPAAKYVGGAPSAGIVFARIVRTRHDPGYTIENDDLLTGVAFLFDRADAMKLPMSANLSIGTDFGPHDGSLSWEQGIASFVGDGSPGHAIAVAAGNSGSIFLTPIHQVVELPAGGDRVHVQIPLPSTSSGSVQIWLTFGAGADVSVGLDGPSGTWIAPVPVGQVANLSTSDYAASIVNGAAATCSKPSGASCQVPGAEIPSGSPGAVVVWDANGGAGFPGGTYAVTLEGSGLVNLWLSSDVTFSDGTGVGFAYGVREGTINLPGTQPGLVAVGCTVNRTTWTAIDDAGWGLASTPGLDTSGGMPADGGLAPFISGEVCWFSSAGPTVTGVQKPEISAPGSFVIGALSSQALPGTDESIFTSIQCVDDAGVDPACLEVDPQHAVAEGTSMSAPMVAGAVALFLERDPTLTQTQIVPILQGGAHYFRSGPALFEDQGGPGELDVLGSLAVMDLMSDPKLMLPSADKSWLTLSTDHVAADGSLPTMVIVELRTEAGLPADLFQASRLQPVATVSGAPLAPAPPLTRRGPGVWYFTVQPPAGLGGSFMTLGATFDGKPIVASRTVPIATDPWTADYPSSAGGSSCAVTSRSVRGGRGEALAWVAWLAALAATRRRAKAGRSTTAHGRRASSAPCPP